MSPASLRCGLLGLALVAIAGGLVLVLKRDARQTQDKAASSFQIATAAEAFFHANPDRIFHLALKVARPAKSTSDGAAALQHMIGLFEVHPT